MCRLSRGSRTRRSTSPMNILQEERDFTPKSFYESTLGIGASMGYQRLAIPAVNQQFDHGSSNMLRRRGVEKHAGLARLDCIQVPTPSEGG